MAEPVAPLDPLRPDEVEAALAAVRAEGQLDDQARISLVTVDEPGKAAVESFSAGDPVPAGSESPSFPDQAEAP